MNEQQNKAVPIYILSGFLGSGKTTLLKRLIQNFQHLNLKPAVIMNEIGDVNLDGLLVEEQVPMSEMLGGCICCSIRGDLGLEIANLIQSESPDVIVVESTGIANPMEILDAVTETSLYMMLELKSVITVVDAAHLFDLYKEQKGKTYRLMQEQIRCADVLILNKTDRVSSEQIDELKQTISRWNPFALLQPAVQCDVDLGLLLTNDRTQHTVAVSQEQEHPDLHHHEHHEHYEHDHHHTDHDHVHHHVSHDHVMVYTHYFTGPIDSTAFEAFIAELPREVYRGKGILSFTDTSSRFLFQYAYRELDFIKIDPQGQVQDVAVFIGEHFDKTVLIDRLKALELN
ncbi:CobW family GTP-binding protein [Paenibacillus sediminis]|uniref:G3E family GTPase n=1 Tax=Paenibacillus sediminis TaxID=664909 RepID=A0ABS4H1E8_9BACL|nr:CobW family GTP-binding protein [Paenibacillus sediminis]MBP1936335.1 G3E family GTPase [Paenibacillus sediminis]